MSDLVRMFSAVRANLLKSNGGGWRDGMCGSTSALSCSGVTVGLAHTPGILRL